MSRLRSTALVALLLVAGCSRPTPTDSAPQIEELPTPTSTSAAPVAQAVALGASVDVTTPAGSASYTVGNWRPVPPDAQIIPAKGAMYSADVVIEGRAGVTTVNGFYFFARTPDGATVAPAVGAVRPGVTYGQLAQGQSVSGQVAFDFAPGTAVTGIGLRDAGGKQLAFWMLQG